MSISGGSLFYRDANGIRTDHAAGFRRASDASRDIAGDASWYNGTNVQTPIVYVFPSADPGGPEGYLYYDSTAHKLRVRTAVGYETVTSA